MPHAYDASTKYLVDDRLAGFRYQVVRVWELAAEEVLASGLGVLSLAPLSNVTSKD